jgi:hypothetical protein
MLFAPIIMAVVMATTSYAGDRVFASGDEMLDIGECKGSICILHEESTSNGRIVLQFIDLNDGKVTCDFAILFRYNRGRYHYIRTYDCSEAAKIAQSWR